MAKAKDPRAKGSAVINVNTKIYPLDVVLSAGYVFLDRCYVMLDGDPEGTITVELRPKDRTDAAQIAREFQNELVNYANYAVQAIKNEWMREAIVRRVLMTNEIVENAQEEPCAAQPPEEEQPWFDDPEGIAIPWEEKYGPIVKPWETATKEVKEKHGQSKARKG